MTVHQFEREAEKLIGNCRVFVHFTSDFIAIYPDFDELNMVWFEHRLKNPHTIDWTNRFNELKGQADEIRNRILVAQMTKILTDEEL